MGGETCAEYADDAQTISFCDCEPSILDMERYHWTYLNIDYNKNVLNRWKTQKCYSEVQQRLGYRLVLEKLKYTPNPAAGKEFKVVLEFRNDGFSAFQNPRNAKLVFLSNNTPYTYDLGSDPRTWHPGTHRVETSFTLPSSTGTLYLVLSDPLLPNRAEFSAALANKDVWDSAKGWNKLLEIK